MIMVIIIAASARGCHRLAQLQLSLYHPLLSRRSGAARPTPRAGLAETFRSGSVLAKGFSSSLVSVILHTRA